jgi:hypothetical protein
MDKLYLSEFLTIEVAVYLQFSGTKLPNLELKTRAKQLLDSLPITFALSGNFIRRIEKKNPTFSLGGEQHLDSNLQSQDQQTSGQPPFLSSSTQADIFARQL